MADLTFILRPFWLGTDLTGADLTWGRFDWKSLMWQFHKASSRASRVSLQLLWGEYLPGGIGMKSLIGWPKMHIAGESFVSLSGVFLYWSITHWNASMSRSPLGPVLSAIRHLIVLTPTSALQLLRGKETEDRQWCIPQSWRNWLVAVTVNSGPPSDASSSGFPKVSNVRRRQVMSPAAPFEDLSTIGQFDYLSTTTR